MSTFLLATISLVSGVVAFAALVAISAAAEAVEKGLRWVQRLGKAQCRRCHCPIPKTDTYCERHRHLGSVHGGVVRRRRPAVPQP